ncbi:MAG: hypothetical protein OEY61_13385 [Gammaproteobacteria bacterium]|nr:hypothetical protein [Gammaproteobacteria bacterium]
MQQKLKNWLKLLITCYSCISLIGCATHSILSGKYGAIPKYWIIEDISFAALQEQRYVRFCAKLKHHTGEMTAELKLDLEQFSKQLKKQGKNTNGFNESSKLVSLDGNMNYCNPVLQKNEKEIQVVIRELDAPDVLTALNEISYEEHGYPAVIILYHNEDRYIVYASQQLPPFLIDQTFGYHVNNESDYTIYMLLPLALVVDVFQVVVCVITLPVCLVALKMTGGIE